MPKAKTLLSRLESARFKAFFVVLVMLLNVSFTTLSSAVAYADTAEPSVETENVEEQTEVVTSTEETDEETPAEESLEAEESTEPVVEEEEAPESTNDETQEDEPEVLSTVVVVNDEESDFEATFDCWMRVGLMEYTFYVDYTTSSDETWATGTEYNSADPESQESILPTMFPSAEDSVEVTGWDGTSFEWTLGMESLKISLENDRCESPTVGDVVVENADTGVLEAIVTALVESETICASAAIQLFDPTAGPFTIFAPTDSAIANIVQMPGTSSEELNQLLGNPDELCALIASHIVAGEIVSTDATEEGVTVPVIANDVDGLFIQLVDGKVLVDGAEVVEANLFGSNGVVHVVDSVLLPQSVGTINPVVTDKTSPALSGTINASVLATEDMEIGFCVLVRVDGIPYIADVDGMTWSIEEGVVSVNPTKANTLFDVVVRSEFGNYKNTDSLVQIVGCDDMVAELRVEAATVQSAELQDVETHGGRLFGLTMNRNVLSFLEPEEEEPGEVLGETVTVEPEEEETVAVVPAQTCGKGVCGDVAQAPDPSTIDTDGDGVVDSEDPDPLDPNVTGLEDGDESSDDGEEEPEDDETNVLLWFLAGGGVVLVWYLLWQRSGREA